MEHTRQAYTHSITKYAIIAFAWFVHDCSHCTEGLLRDLTHTQTLIHNVRWLTHPQHKHYSTSMYHCQMRGAYGEMAPSARVQGDFILATTFYIHTFLYIELYVIR